MAAALRQVVLSLIQSLLIPKAAATNPEAEAAAKANGAAFVEAGGVQLLVDMLTGRHRGSQNKCRGSTREGNNVAL